MKNRIKQFYSEHEVILGKLHPGLTLHTLTRELEWLYQIQGFKLDLEFIWHELLSGKPLAYIIGYQYFYDSFFKVEPCTLIPRPESELIVARALELVKNKKLKAIDVGTGTGAIGLSIAKNVATLEMTLTDISEDALNLAKQNYFQHGFQFSQTQKVNFLHTDRLFGVNDQFDLIVSNPPYIKAQADRHAVSQQVLQYEPELALFLPDGLYEQWFSEFFKQVADCLSPNGIFLMEGHEAHLDDLAKLMGALGKFDNIQVHNDLTGRARFIESHRHG